MRSTLVTVVASIALLAAAVKLQAARERAYPPSPLAAEDAVYLQSGRAVRRLSGAYNALAADAYWVRAIQYYGGTKRRLAGEAKRPDPPPMLAAPTDDYAYLF